MLFCVTMINFIDRQTLSVTAPKLREIFQLSNTQYGIIVSAFQFGMVAGEFPMGWLMDWRGARFGLTFAVIWWSIANAMHALARSLTHFSLFRFWLGTGECGNFSGGNKVVSQWFPVKERAFAIGIFNSASMIGTMVAPFLIVPILHRYGWQTAFLVPSLLGIGVGGGLVGVLPCARGPQAPHAGRGRLHPERPGAGAAGPEAVEPRTAAPQGSVGADAVPLPRRPGGPVLHLLDARVPVPGPRLHAHRHRVLRVDPVPLRRPRQHRRRVGLGLPDPPRLLGPPGAGRDDGARARRCAS